MYVYIFVKTFTSFYFVSPFNMVCLLILICHQKHFVSLGLLFSLNPIDFSLASSFRFSSPFFFSIPFSAYIPYHVDQPAELLVDSCNFTTQIKLHKQILYYSYVLFFFFFFIPFFFFKFYYFRLFNSYNIKRKY